MSILNKILHKEEVCKATLIKLCNELGLKYTMFEDDTVFCAHFSDVSVTTGKTFDDSAVLFTYYLDEVKHRTHVWVKMDYDVIIKPQKNLIKIEFGSEEVFEDLDALKDHCKNMMIYYEQIKLMRKQINQEKRKLSLEEDFK